MGIACRSFITIDAAEEFLESVKVLLAMDQVMIISAKGKLTKVNQKKVKTKREARKQVEKAESIFKANSVDKNFRLRKKIFFCELLGMGEGGPAGFRGRFAVGTLLARRISNRCLHRVRIAAIWDVGKDTITRGNRMTRASERTRASGSGRMMAILGTILRPVWALYVGTG